MSDGIFIFVFVILVNAISFSLFLWFGDKYFRKSLELSTFYLIFALY